VIAGIWPLVSLRNAEFMKNELRISVPDAIVARMAHASSTDAARAEGIAIAQEMLAATKPMVQGTQLSIPLGRYGSAAEILNVLGGHFSAKA
jgi:homocysteine S-methyltransferase